MRKTNAFGATVWVSLIWLAFETYLGRLLAVKTQRLFAGVLLALNRLP